MIHLKNYSDTPGLRDPKMDWTNTKLRNVKLNAYFNSTSGRYGFARDTTVLMAVTIDAPHYIEAMVGRAVGLLPELPKKSSFEKDICNPFLKNPCAKPKTGL